MKSKPWLLYTVTAAVFALYVFGAIVSFAGLYGIAPWLKMPPSLYWSFPFAIDLGIILYKVAEVEHKRADAPKRKVRKAMFGSLALTFVSSVGNVVHVAADPDPDALRLYGGIFFAGLMPWFVYLSASVLTDLIVRPKRDILEEEVQKVVAEANAVEAQGDEWERTSMPEQPVDRFLAVAQTEGFSISRDIPKFPESWGEEDGK